MPLIDKILQTILVLIMGSMSLVVAANVFCRFLLNFSLPWADETAQILLVWLTFLGAALAVKEKSHYALNYLIDRLSGPARRNLIILLHTFSILAIVVLLYFSTIVTWQIYPWVMPATEISRAFVYAACPVGCLLMLYYAIANSLHGRKTANR
ncbi:MAG: TRAP transporter small permease [Cyclobacteriaceae bacterium]